MVRIRKASAGTAEAFLLVDSAGESGFLFLVFGIVAIAVAITVAVTFAVAIAIGILALAHIDAVDNCSQFGELVAVLKNIDVLVAVLRGVVGTAGIDAEVGYTADDGGVGHHTDGGGVENDVVITFLQHVDHVVEHGAGYQFCRVRGNRAAGENLEIRTDLRFHNEAHQVGVLGIVQVIGNAFGTAGETKGLVQTGLTDVHTEDDHFLTQEGQTDGGVSGQEGFTFARLGGGEENHLFLRLQHKEHVGAQTAEGFFHHVVFIFTDHDGTVGRRITFGEFGQNGDGRDALHILAVLNLIFQKVAEVDKANGEAKPENEGGQGNDATLGRYRF